ncbi:MAG: glycosyltransferase family protein [Anaerovibrio sp.]|nr:glycosyltransferase family protein [Anaerovibrio sp.]
MHREEWANEFLRAGEFEFNPGAVDASLPASDHAVAPGGRKVAFITCVNNEEWYHECSLFINNLIVPEGVEVELIPVQGAASMCSGYNWGMRHTDAKYKVYLHQDTLIANKNFIGDMLQIFSDDNIGALGVIGAKRLPASGVWWDAMRTVGEVLHACEAESVVETHCQEIEGEYAEVEAVDGLLFATQVDLPWREDIFTGWHFYEISQCMELQRRGYKVVVPRQKDYWCIHCPKEKPLDKTYKAYQKKFLKEYGKELVPEF